MGKKPDGLQLGHSRDRVIQALGSSRHASTGPICQAWIIRVQQFDGKGSKHCPSLCTRCKWVSVGLIVAHIQESESRAFRLRLESNAGTVETWGRNCSGCGFTRPHDVVTDRIVELGSSLGIRHKVCLGD